MICSGCKKQIKDGEKVMITAGPLSVEEGAVSFSTEFWLSVSRFHEDCFQKQGKEDKENWNLSDLEEILRAAGEKKIDKKKLMKIAAEHKKDSIEIAVESWYTMANGV